MTYLKSVQRQRTRSFHDSLNRFAKYPLKLAIHAVTQLRTRQHYKLALFQSRVPIWPVALEVGSTPQIKHRAFYRNRQQQCLYRWNVTNSYFKSDNLASLLKLINRH